MEAVVDRFRRMYPDVLQVKEQFNKYDADGDGNITAEEMENGMTEFKDFTRDQAKFAFELADTNEDGKIDISEFVSLMFPSAKEAIANLRKAFKGPDDVARKFKLWDSDGDGKISFEELKESAAKDTSKFLTEEDINSIFIVGDLNLDGEIDEGEFAKLMLPSISDIVAKFRYAHKSVEDVRKAFKTYDRDGDGSIDRGELHKALTNYKFNFSDQEVDIIFVAGDIDGDGSVDFEEFMYLMCPSTSQIVKKFRENYKTINEVKAAFRKFDKNRDGGLSKSELSRMMMSTGHSFTDMEIDAIMNLGDRDGDGEIDLEEFMFLMTPSASETLNKIKRGITSIADVKGLFKDIDVDGDGLLSKEEMLNSPGCKFDREQVEAIYELGDSNGDEVLDMGEFIAIMYPSAGEALAKLSKNYPNIDEVKALFKQIDYDNDGSITPVELAECSIKFTPQEIESIFALGDINDDGAIDLEEFIGVMYPDAATVAGRLRGQYTDINDIKKAFSKIDTNGDGKVSKEEVASSGTFNSQEIDALFILGDANNDGEIDLEEFIGVLYPVVAAALAKMTKDIKNVDDARFLFKQLDHDGDALLSQEELRKSGCKFSAKEIEALFAVGDINGDGEIDINEFINVMCPGATTVVSRISSQFKCLEDIQDCFTKMDLDGDGKITREEMMEYSALNEQEVNAVFDLGDTDRDGSIDLNEFIGVMQTSAPVPYKEGGTIVKVGNSDVYMIGSGPKCLIWCHDMKGYASGDRTRQLVDKLSESTGCLIVMPDFLGEKKILESADEYSWLSSITEWNTIRDFWVEKLLPYLRDDLAIKAIGVVGTGWGSYVATRLSSYGEILACVNIQPLISSAVEAAKEDLYEVYEDVRCPQLMLACRNNCPNEKPGGLASNIYNSCSFGKNCEFVELHDMMHGFLLEGDRSIEAIAVQSRLTMKRTEEFFGKFLHYDGEPVPVVEVCCAEKGIDDFDIKTHSSDSCKTCLAISHQANKAASRCM
eukprot:GFUD01028374.1.p1 GENE.GFUD01028374.1~~GFUD01028374.1.p1  ORF type:complete len:1019 (+),score=296.62 GFUD01028374.1:74-3058(+)